MIVQNGLEKQVTFCAHTPNIDQELAKHKIFVMSSFYEGLNLSVLEAMASGCVVVGSKTVGVEELITNGQDGFLFDIQDSITLAEILEKVLQSPSKYQYLADHSREKACRHYDKQVRNAAYEKLFLSLIKTRVTKK